MGFYVPGSSADKCLEKKNAILSLLLFLVPELMFLQPSLVSLPTSFHRVETLARLGPLSTVGMLMTGSKQIPGLVPGCGSLPVQPCSSQK